MRHGHTAFNQPAHPIVRAQQDVLLTLDGQLDALKAAQKLKPLGPQRIYSSDLERDLKTAEIIGRYCQIPNDVEYDLRTWNLGDLAGEREEDVNNIVLDLYREPWKDAPGGGESFNSWSSRLSNKVDQICEESKAIGPIVAVTHGKSIALLHARTENLLPERAAMPLPGGIAVLERNAEGDRFSFLTPSEPVMKDV